jgi:5'-nucleotidase/UDP-sugar diphosphatase
MKAPIQRISSCALLGVLLSVSLPAQGTIITILHVSDTHSHLDGTGPKDTNLNGTLGGVAKAATVIKSIRRSEPNVLLLHSGDLFQGDLFFNKYLGVPELQLMKQLGFDAMAVGNHEFDLGPKVLNESLSKAFVESSFPLLSANLDMNGYPDLKKWIQPSVVKIVGDIRIGIFGMTIPDDPTTQPAPVIIQKDIVPIAQHAVTELRNKGVDVVICVSHSGFLSDRLIAEKVSGIDFIVGGHDHVVFKRPISIRNPSGKLTRIIHGGEHYKHIGKLRFTVKNGAVQLLDYRLLPVGASVRPDTSIQSVVSTLKEEVIRQYGDVYRTVIGSAARDLAKETPTKGPVRDTPMGNLITDAYRKKTGTDIALTANGFISERIWKGPIVAADVFRAVSYGYDDSSRLGYKLATFEILGSELIKGLEMGVANLEGEESYFIQVSGMNYNYDLRRQPGERVLVETVRIKGKPLDPTAKYTVTVNTGILGLLSFLGLGVENIHVLPVFEYTVVKDFMSTLKTITYTSEGRIRDAQR